MANFSDRQRFNWGFHDGTWEASEGRERNVSEHPDPVYVAGYRAGVASYQERNEREVSSQRAWNAWRAAIAAEAKGERT